jgi:hypothetical protein
VALSSAQRARYARHLLLPELGELGQERLLSSRARPTEHADAGALAVARSYLERAGVAVVQEQASTQLLVACSAEVEALAGAPYLLEAARALAGAFAAVETIKSVVAIGHSSELPRTLSLASEDA